MRLPRQVVHAAVFKCRPNSDDPVFRLLDEDRDEYVRTDVCFELRDHTLVEDRRTVRRFLGSSVHGATFFGEVRCVVGATAAPIDPPSQDADELRAPVGLAQHVVHTAVQAISDPPPWCEPSRR